MTCEHGETGPHTISVGFGAGCGCPGPHPVIPKWPDGSIAAPMENGATYLTDVEGYITGIHGPVEMMTREQIRERFPNIEIP